MRIIDNYCFFWTGFMSQWTREYFIEDGITFNCCEQYMMYKKAIHFSDFKIADRILKEDDPSKIKQLGRRISNFDEISWSLVKFDIVRQGNLLRFSQNPNSLKRLLEYSEYELVEASPYDSIWGIGMNETNPDIMNIQKWGQNLLGIALTDVMLTLRDLVENEKK